MLNFTNTLINNKKEEKRMKKIAIIALSTFLVLMMVPTSLIAGGTDKCFSEAYQIAIPDADLNTGGWGKVITGVDLDADGLTDMYLVNDMYDNVLDGAHEEIPRIYKLEWDGTTWVQEWYAEAPIAKQNTWPTLNLADLDGDGKMELVWAIANNSSENPFRILVYEHNFDDEFGVWDGATGWQPNSSWTIATEDGVNSRLINTDIADIDGDGTPEVIFADRKGHYWFGVCSVDDIPDNGDGSETWTMEYSGMDVADNSLLENQWDIAVIGNSFYSFDEVQISKVTWNGTAYEYSALPPLPGGISFGAAQVADLDGDGNMEILTGEYSYGDATRHIWLLQEDGAGGLTQTPLFDIAGEGFLNGGRLIGGAMGDIDQDGFMDFVFGTRYGDPNARIIGVSYRGGDVTDPANYNISVLAEGLAESGGVWDVVEIANVDADPELEVLYGSSRPYGADLFNPNTTGPLVVLDYDPECEHASPLLGLEGTETVVDGYKLGQNYPNPFNPATNITLEIPSDELVTLTIYDMLGHAVKTLVKQNLTQGVYSVTWDGKDNSGVIVPAGTYVYQLKAGDVVKMQKMTYIK